jgi:Putative peptidoglycan binding domain.
MKRITAIILAILLVISLAAEAAGEENRIWQEGDTGEKVLWIQTRLMELEYLEREPTGTFDPETGDALREFQRNQGLLQTGMADRVTMAALENATRKASDYRSPVVSEKYWETAEYEMDDGLYSMAAMPMATAAWKQDVYWNTEEYTAFGDNRFLSVRNFSAVHLCGGMPILPPTRWYRRKNTPWGEGSGRQRAY